MASLYVVYVDMYMKEKKLLHSALYVRHLLRSLSNRVMIRHGHLSML